MKQSDDNNTQLITPTSDEVLRLLQITDCHVFAEPEACLRGLNTRSSFEATCKRLIEDNAQADVLLATGDLSQDGSAESYQYLAGYFNAMAIPTFWIPGNHDDMESIARHFKADQVFAAKQIFIGSWQLILLDSTIAGEIHGRLSADQLEFLKSALHENPEKHSLVCLHHQALDVGSRWIDLKGLENAQQFRQLLAQFSSVRAVIWGHVHQEVHQTRDRIEWMATPSSCFQFMPGSDEFAVGTEAPGYRSINLYPDGTLLTAVHRIDS